MKTKKGIWIIIAIVLIIAIILGIIFLNNNQTKKEDTIKIGIIAPLTGSLAEYGIAFKNGIELLNNENNNSKIEYIFEDNKFDPKEAISAFNKLTQIDKVNLIMNWGTPTSESIAPLTKTTEIPFIAVSTEPIVTRESKYVIRGAFNQPKDYIQILWPYLRSHNITKIGIIKTQLVYLDTLYNELVKEKKSNEQIDLIDTYDSDNKDFKASLLKISNNNYDAIGVFLVSGQISQFYKQAKEMDISVPTFGSDFFESQSEIDNAQGLMNNAVFANTGVTNEFYDRYKQKFNSVSQITFAGAGYDLAMIINTQVNFTDKESVLNSFESIKDFPGVEGNLSYVETNDDRYFTKNTYLKKIVNNSVVVIG